MNDEDRNPAESQRGRRKRLFRADEIDAARERLSHGLTSLDIEVDEFSIRSVNRETGKEIIIELIESEETEESSVDS